MSNRASILISLPVLLTCCSFGAPAVSTDGQAVSLDKPVHIPEAVLPPGKYTIRVEDRMADRAIVRITEASGADHYLLSVPAKKWNAPAKGLIFFPAAADTEVLQAWQCNGCSSPLEFVYPKDEAVKLTAETGKPVLAYDPSYDKLPAHLSAADRRIVTLWLLTPKTVTASGKGEGLTAAKYSEAGIPKMRASAESLPARMPKTATSAFLELSLGILLLVTAVIVRLWPFLWRKRRSALPKIWKMAGLTMLGGMAIGFALPIASSYETDRFYSPPPAQLIQVAVMERDSEIAGLKARNRRLEALVDVLQRKFAVQ